MATIKEDFVSFETAKLLKEKNCPDFGYSCICDSEGNKAQTQSIIIKWLREVHNIFIEISVSIDLNGKYHYSYSILNRECKYIRKGYTDFDWDYKQSCEAAIKYSLENLI